jgi:argininosuccinate lyase
MTKIWQGNVNKKIEKFTVGNDFIIDQKLLKYDCIASIAHSKMLKKIKILTEQEQKKLEDELNNIIELNDKCKFTIKSEDEDCHTAIENHLTKKLGDLGKKIHTARSRNDQVVAAMKLYEKDELNDVSKLVKDLINALKKIPDVIMPGYTHMQKAMPSSTKLWAEGFIETLEDDLV